MVLLEFFDSNTHRCYPFEMVNDLPTDLIVDIQFVTSNNINKNSVYINKVIATQDHVQFEVACKLGTDLVSLGLLMSIPTTATAYTEHSFTLVNDTHKVIIQGSMTIGHFNTLLHKSVWSDPDKQTSVYLLGESGKILSQCVTPVTEWCTGLVINDKLYTGNIILNIGDGLELIEAPDPSTPDVTHLVLRATGFVKKDFEVMTDEEIIEEVLNRLGSCVTSINGLTGAVNIVTGAYKLERNVDIGSKKISDANNLKVQTITGEDGGSVIISNITDDPNFDVNTGAGIDTSVIGTLLANATALNDRAGMIEQHNYALDNAVNLLGTQLAKID